MRALLLNPGEPVRVVEVADGLAGLQACIGGLVENFARFELVGGSRVADVWGSDDSTGLPGNRLVRVPGYEFPISGPIAVTVGDERNGETCSFTDAELALALRVARSWPVAITLPEGVE